jgi:phage terminase small subunit
VRGNFVKAGILLMALKGKKLKFAEAKMVGKSNKDAAIAAGCSVKSASAAGSRLAKDIEVVAYLATRKVAAPRQDATQPDVPITAPPEKQTPTFDVNAALMHTDPKAFLLVAMNDMKMDHKLRVDAAKALMPFVHAKLGDVGKKAVRGDAAKEAANKFASTPPPPLPLRSVK